jgi:uncharacterized membrane protein
MPSVPDTGAPSEPPFFHAILRPEGVMGATSFALLSAAILSAALAFGALLLVRGLPIAALFLAADVTLVLGLLYLCRQRRSWTEELRADRAGVAMHRYDHAGRCRESAALPLMALTLEREVDPDYGLRRLRLVSRGRSVELGRDLAPSERAGLADRFEAALRNAACPPRARVVTLPGFQHAEPAA